MWWSWLAAFVLGAAAGLLASLFGVLGFFFVLLIIPGMSRRTALAAMSGALTGFGGTMLVLLMRAGRAGGAGDDGTLLVFAGVVPLALGLALGVAAFVAARRAPS